MFPYYRDKTGCYIRVDEFEKIRYYQDSTGKKQCMFTHKNLKKKNMIRLGNIWSAKKLPDEIKHYKILSNRYVKVPSGISSFSEYDFTHNYASQVIEHPDLSRTSYDYQASAVQELCVQPVGLLHASTGSGKAQPLNAKVLGKYGWIRMGDIKIGDQVFTQDGTLTNVIGVYPQGKKEVYRVTFSDGGSTTACGEHLWEVQDVNDRRHGTKRVVDTKHIKENLRTYNDSRNNFSIDFCKPIQFERQRTSVHPYLMGLFLGDGHAKKDYLDITTGEQDIVDRISKCIKSSEGISIDKDSRSNAIRVRITGQGKRSSMLSTLDHYGLTGCNSFNKFIPTDYLHTSIEDRKLLLQGLLDSDGSVKPNSGSIEFSTTSIQLMEGVIFLVRSLGGTAGKIKERTSSYIKNGIGVSCRNHYRVYISFTNGVIPVQSLKNKERYNPSPLKNNRYIVSVEPLCATECQCIMVDHPSHLYITDDFVVTHNTQMISDVLVRLKRKTLIVVQNLTQMQQMVDDITNILGVIPTQFSGKKPSKKEQATWYPHITVCSIDSRDKINPQDYGLILLDEADTYLGSDDRRDWVGSISPEYLYALTGTIKINHVDDDIFTLYYGRKTELKLHHHTPDYKQVYSSFEYFLDDIKDFHELKSALYGSEDRNELIVNTVLKNISGRKCVVFTEHIEHANTLSEAFKAHGKTVYTLIGEVPKDERERIRQAAKEAKGEVILVGSVKILGRGFDLPELSLGVLTTCEKFQSSITQYLGRIIRHYEGKPHPVFIDIVDHLSQILLNQAKSRIQTFKRTFPEGKVINY